MARAWREKKSQSAIRSRRCIPANFALAQAVRPDMAERPAVVLAKPERAVMRSEAEQTAVRHGIAAEQVGEVGRAS
jgi:hypothetical protein